MDDVADTLRAVLLHPTEQVPKIMHADALAERNDTSKFDAERAELIKLQIDLNNDEYGPSCLYQSDGDHGLKLCGRSMCRFCLAAIRVSELQTDDRHRRAWVPEYDRWLRPLWWSEGFVYKIVVAGPLDQNYLRWLRDVATAHPFSTVQYTGSPCYSLVNGSHWVMCSRYFRIEEVATSPRPLAPYLRGDRGEPILRSGPKTGQWYTYEVVKYPDRAAAIMDMEQALVRYAHAPIREPELVAQEEAR